ncbi:transporter [Lysobacter helvus]|uniref:Transporter n=2 Tax=Lysobacteraceae TaxID=32033 RepID=A0ABN6FW98_9GAMM|nr:MULTISPECIES: HlyD family secretion protein [Lysobacter]BCT93225.1 transporter [Lysobacter caseinilyticus]BCT96377.1 transporter [Lysobacter helvus]
MSTQPAPATAPPPAPAPDKPDRLRRIVKITLLALLVLFLYNIVADRITPYSSQANVDTYLVQIAPEVSGPVVQVGVRDNRLVRKGQLLFRIDEAPYRIALQAAEASLAVALQAEQSSAADVRVADAALRKQRADLAESQKLGKIVLSLAQKRALSETSAIRARADIEKTSADLTRAEAEAVRARIRLGEGSNGNPQVQQALIAVEQAKLDLRRTSVVAPADGAITNLRLAAGQYANRGSPVLSFIGGGNRWVMADMRENQLGNIAAGNRALVVFDDHPGHVFPAHVESVGWGVTQGGEAPTGQLPDVSAPAGWLREPQRFPVRIALDPPEAGEAPLPPGRSGAQANVVVLTRDTSVFNPLARLWIRVVSWMSYLR